MAPYLDVTFLAVEFFLSLASPLSMLHRVIIAGLIWTTTTRATKPMKTRTRMPLAYTLWVSAAKAPVLDTRLRVIALQSVVNIDFAFLTFLLCIFIENMSLFVF